MKFNSQLLHWPNFAEMFEYWHNPFSFLFSFFFLLQSAGIVMDLTELFQCNLMEEFGNIMNHSVRSMSVESTSEWWAKRNRLDSKMKVKWKSNKGICFAVPNLALMLLCLEIKNYFFPLSCVLLLIQESWGFAINYRLKSMFHLNALHLSFKEISYTCFSPCTSYTHDCFNNLHD